MARDNSAKVKQARHQFAVYVLRQGIRSKSAGLVKAARDIAAGKSLPDALLRVYNNRNRSGSEARVKLATTLMYYFPGVVKCRSEKS